MGALRASIPNAEKGTHRQSRWFFICGPCPRILATRHVASVNLPPAIFPYRLPVNGLKFTCQLPIFVSFPAIVSFPDQHVDVIRANLGFQDIDLFRSTNCTRTKPWSSTNDCSLSNSPKQICAGQMACAFFHITL